ncbi:hypothetical protein [Janthinobacterium sp.]|uniref:hypothetical protein n=1 Tax=Janthinobacterium sp. TaxID=1871054 RepID=UPI00262A731C|nr:hypothetical protein [Janthinobacterium sp.]
MKKLKAYEVREPDEGHSCIIFATNNATAHREGANELNVDWEGVEHCRRAAQFDTYAPGPVPSLVLIEHGWWFECHQCGRKIDEYMSCELEHEGLDPSDFTPCETGQMIFCCAACQAQFYAKRRANKAAKVALIELFEAKFPNCTIKDIHVYGAKLEPSEKGHGSKCSVSFLFPGAKYGATFEYGNSDLYVANGDVEAFREWAPTLSPLAPA